MDSAAAKNAAVVAQLREQIQRLQAAPRGYLSSLRTGVAAFDGLFPGHGLPLGQAVELWGEAASGRTSLALRTVAAAGREERLSAWIDGPHELYPPAAVALGVLVCGTAACGETGPVVARVSATDQAAEDGVLSRGAAPKSLDWRIEPVRRAGPPGEVQFSIGYRQGGEMSNMGDRVPLATLDGLTPQQLAAAGGPVRFTLHRDAGDFACEGVASRTPTVGAAVTSTFM